MGVIIKNVEMPKNCCDCACHNGENGECQVTGSRDTWCNEPPRSCPIKSVDGLIEIIEQAKQYKGRSGNPYIDAHDVGLDRHFDLGLDKAIKIIKEYCEA